MKVELLQTEGRGCTAEIAVDGVRLSVVDGISSADTPATPGPIEHPRFEVVCVAPVSWQRAVAANPNRACKLEPLWGWRYRGSGRVVGLDPVRLDLGALELDLPLPEDASRQVGDYVEIAIDRIRITRAAGVATG